MPVTNVYGLFDPRAPDVIMYVGKGLEKRAQQHWKFFLAKGTAVNALLRRWFERLKVEGITPSWRFLEENVADWQAHERAFISTWRVMNPVLCNVADGGNDWPLESKQLGGGAHVMSDEAKKRLRIGAHNGGRIGGRRRIELHGNSWTPEGSLKGGRIGGRRRIELHGNPGTPEGASKGGSIGNHLRWHVNRNQPNPECQLCFPEFHVGSQSMLREREAPHE